MTQKSPSKYFLFYPIENHRNDYQLTNISIPNTIEINTEQIQLHCDIETNTPNYTEQIARAIDNGNVDEEIAQMFMQAEVSETYWQLITERRQQAIKETNIENQQLHSLIDGLSKENDKLRIIANHCDYLQNILETLTTENDTLHLDETNADNSRID